MGEKRILLLRKVFEAVPLWVVFHYSIIERPDISVIIDSLWMKEEAVITSSAVHGYSKYLSMTWDLQPQRCL